jgi:acyl-CoA synthetase (AMP-forming)/AMP-acid ligase II
MRFYPGSDRQQPHFSDARPAHCLSRGTGPPNWRDWDLSSYRFLSTGATVVPIELMKRLQAETSIAEITTGYGMTECCGSATHTRPGDSMERVAYTVGTALPGTEIRGRRS